MEHVEQAAVLDDHNAVASRVALRRQEIDAIRDLLAGGEVVVGAVLVGHCGHVGQGELLRLRFLRRGKDRRVRECRQQSGVIGMLVGDKYLRDIVRGVAQRLQCVEVVLDTGPHVDHGLFVRHLVWHAVRQTRIHQDHFAAGIDDEVLKA